MAPSDFESFRARFPILSRRIYVNNCSQGALSLDVEAAVERYLESWRELGSPWDRWVMETERLRTVFAASIGAEPDEVAVMPSASVAIAAIATSLPFRAPRTRVVIGDLEFPTMGHGWLAAERRGAEIVWLRSSGIELAVSEYERAIDGRTLIVPLTSICYKSGVRTDAAAISRLCRERSAYLFIDDYQRTGTGPIDVGALGADFLVTGCLKYLLGASGVALLWVRRDLIDRLEPLVTGWFGRARPFDFEVDRLDWSTTARRFETGSPPVVNIYAAAAGVELLSRVGYRAIEERIERLVDRFIAGANDAGYVLLTAREPHRRGPLVVLRSTDGDQLVRRLADRGVITSARANGLRVSFHAYNNEDDVDAVLEALRLESPLIERQTAVRG